MKFTERQGHSWKEDRQVGLGCSLSSCCRGRALPSHLHHPGLPAWVGASGAPSSTSTRVPLNDGSAPPQVCEENGCFAGADPSKVSDRAKKRGLVQLGSLGSGNHYTEIQVGRRGCK